MKIIRYVKARVFHILPKNYNNNKYKWKRNYFYLYRTKPWKKIINKRIRQKQKRVDYLLERKWTYFIWHYW